MEFWNNITAYFNNLGIRVDGIDTNVGNVWRKIDEVWLQGAGVVKSLAELQKQIDSLTQYLQMMQTVGIILSVIIVIQFFLIVWILAGQVELKKKLIKFEEFFLDRGIENGKQSNCG